MKFRLTLKHPFMQTTRLKLLVAAGVLFIFAAVLTSCASQNKLGCPMKIGQVKQTAKVKDC
jgi:hypothetical protein